MKKRFFLLLTLVSVLFSTALFAAGDKAVKNEKPFVIPELREWQGATGTFAITPETKIVYGKKDARM